MPQTIAIDLKVVFEKSSHCCTTDSMLPSKISLMSAWISLDLFPNVLDESFGPLGPLDAHSEAGPGLFLAL